MKKDIEYMLTKATGLEEVVFSSDRLKDISKFCKISYNSIRTYVSKGKTFYFEGKPVRIERIDMNADYEQ
jgi:hypothetical protein